MQHVASIMRVRVAVVACEYISAFTVNFKVVLFTCQCLFCPYSSWTRAGSRHSATLFADFLHFLLSALLCRVMGSALSWLSPSSTGAVAKLYTVSTPVRLKVKNVDKLGAEDEVSLSSFLQTRCPSLFSPYTPAWWLNR